MNEGMYEGRNKWIMGCMDEEMNGWKNEWVKE